MDLVPLLAAFGLYFGVAIGCGFLGYFALRKRRPAVYIAGSTLTGLGPDAVWQAMIIHQSPDPLQFSKLFPSPFGIIVAVAWLMFMWALGTARRSGR